MAGRADAPSPGRVATMQQLRSLVHDCLAKHLYDGAIFFADKLVALSGESPAEVYTLAQGFYCSGQYRRCLHLLRSTMLIDKDARIRYLASRSMLACGDLEECLELLGGESAATPAQLKLGPLPPAEPGTISYLSAICLIRARVFDAQESLSKAVTWYRFALETDACNYEAFEALIGSRRLSPVEEAELLAGLKVPPTQGWLKLFYTASARTPAAGQLPELALDQLESTSPAPSSREPTVASKAPPPSRPPETPVPALATDGQDGNPSGRPREGEQAGHQGDRNVRGWGLGESVDVEAARAAWLCHRGRVSESWRVTCAALARDPHALQCLPWHCTAGVRLGKKQDLFLLAHRVMESQGESAVAWFVAGCYYLSTDAAGADTAIRAFSRATRADKGFAPAWLGLAMALSLCGEADASLGAYRSANRLFPGLPEPLLGMARAYGMMNNVPLVEQVLTQAHAISPGDPTVCNELGALAFRMRRYDAAAHWFLTALANVPDEASSSHWSPLLANLGHALRKIGKLAEAEDAFRRAIGLRVGDAATHSALAFTLQLAGKLSEAVEQYHIALGLAPGDSFAADMLAIAVEEDVELFMETVGEQLHEQEGEDMAIH